tara:strand:+ start:1817 stop:2026 length:210 start_codon:yes stop_codon:yes gene_type:complete
MSQEVRWGSGELKIILSDGSELVLKLGDNGQDIFAQRRCNGTTEAYYGLSWPWDEWDDLSPGCTDNEED